MDGFMWCCTSPGLADRADMPVTREGGEFDDIDAAILALEQLLALDPATVEVTVKIEVLHGPAVILAMMRRKRRDDLPEVE